MKASKSSEKSWMDPISHSKNHRRAGFSRNVGNAWQRKGLVTLFNNIIYMNIVTSTWESPMPS